MNMNLGTGLLVEELIFLLAFTSACSLLRLPYENIDGNPVPTVIFKGRPSVFHAFILSLNFAFSGAVVTISLRERCPKMARYCRRLACLAMAVASGVMIWLLLASPLKSSMAFYLSQEHFVSDQSIALQSE